MQLLLTNARLLHPDGIRPGWLRIEDGRVVEIGEGPIRPESRSVDLGGDYLGSGLVDEHLHGALGRDFMEASDEAFEAILRYHAAGGTTSVLPTSVAAPWPEILAFLDRVSDWQARPRAGLPNVLGAHVEGPFLSREKSGAQDVRHLCDPSVGLIDDLLARAGRIRLITLAPELPGALAAIDRLSGAGICVSLGHSDAWDEEARTAFKAGAVRVTHLYNAMSGARRRGPHRIGGLLEAALARRHCLVELIADGQHVSPTLVELVLRAKMPNELRLVSDATAGCGLPEGAAYRLGRRECVVRGGVGLLADGSALAGSTIRLIDGVRHMVRQHRLPLWAAWRLANASWSGGGAPEWCDDPDSGRLRPGRPADLVRLNEDLAVTDVWIRGERLGLDTAD